MSSKGGSNERFGSWLEVFGDRIIATAIPDRISTTSSP
jgi:hypothetical protein